MRKLPRLVCKQISRLIPVKSLFKISTPFFLPFYHVVSNEKLPYNFNYNYRDINQFEKELDFYLKYFRPVPLEYLVSNPFADDQVFHLSFDDGLKECAEIIAPLLLKKGIPATFFVNSGFVDNQALFHKYKASLIFGVLGKTSNLDAEKLLSANQLHGKKILNAGISDNLILDKVAELLEINFEEILEKQKPYLTTGQILELYAKGFSVGAHSCDHPEFWKISEERQIEQVRKSMEWVNNTVQPSIKAFSFPFTDSGVSHQVLKSLKSENICDITFGTAGLKYDSIEHHFQRYPVEQRGDFVQNMKAEWVYFEIRKKIGKATVKH